MKTAIIELIEILNKLKIDSTRPDCITKRTGDYRIGLDKAITEASNLLQKERGQIEEAYKHAQVLHAVGDETRAEQYFNQTFNQPK